MRVQWSEHARNQIRAIFEYIADDRPEAAEGVLLGFFERVDLLVEFPDQGRLWGDGSRPDTRAIVHESYRIVYRVGDDLVSILSIRHTRMDDEVER